ncbi:UNVERIFIED_CONTAM: hypothetical protein Sindi_1382100 [Sesamum indicum]
MQFLTGSNETYDHVRNQILIMDRLPNASRAYSMILSVEKQNQVVQGQSYTSHNMAMQTFKRMDNQKKFQKRKKGIDKRMQVCKECGKTGHLKDVCFEIYGYPDWYKTMLEQRKKNGPHTNRAAAAVQISEADHKALDGKLITEIIRTKVERYLVEKKPQTLAEHPDFEYSGKCIQNLNSHNLSSDMWIIDGQASFSFKFIYC